MNHTIHITGLGAGSLEQLPLGVYRKIQETPTVFVRTVEHPVIAELMKEGKHFISFDHIYEKHDQFEGVYEEIVDQLMEKAKKEDIVYAVPGHPMVAEKTIQLLLEKEEEGSVVIRIEGGQSFLDALFTSVKVDPIEGFQLLDGTDLKKEDINIKQHVIIAQVYDAFIASEVKLTLMEKYPDDYPVYIVTAAGSMEEKVTKLPLYELDHNIKINNLTSLYVPPIDDEELLYKEFRSLRQIIAELRGPNGCPWDQKQTHQSLKRYLIEESYELIHAIDQDDIDNMIEELGDVLLQVMLHAQIGEDDGMFSIDDVIESISAKMVRRHPHVFGDLEVSNADEVVKNWAIIKEREKGSTETSILDKVIKGQPAIMVAHEYQKACSKVGFDWDHVQGALDKVLEEWQEFIVEAQNGHKENQIMEFGDVLFALVNVARFYNIHPEEALIKVNQKFYRRFSYVEKRVKESGRDFKQFTLEEMDEFWNEAKKKGL
ncbi:tetrapyrrole methylase family protein/MazG family protein [Oikeobacillus pervagus]|uniref:Tetrapyrrole methylase family protein/MazG family protein n=1 Tax=Oikeobacillus pervagus TaxID=1325931 RepID=A0AAJ1T0B1_9BACI|nr:nucleoside triphosphate pyrophosphohydrolase [Oikeobacillus pervagus]MDQ0216190.1 tetrapyrrole methylase family protein/MazG family protein [Oikeobacillus pervagus]